MNEDVIDSDLPLEDRSTRARISADYDVPAGTVLKVFGQTMTVVGPGRGQGWIYVTMQLAEDGSTCLGQVSVEQVLASQNAPSDGV